MVRPLVYLTSAWSGDVYEAKEAAARFCRAVYEAGYSPICPILFQTAFLSDAVAQEHKDRVDMAAELLRRSRILVVCGSAVNEEVKRDIALAKHLRIVATTLEGIQNADGKGRKTL